MALLFSTLRNAAPLPQFFIDALGEQCDSFIARIVLDGILKVDVNDAMVCGPDAVEIVADETISKEPEQFIARLSRRALEYAESLDLRSAVEVSSALYSYNATPASARWRRILCDRVKVESYLRIDCGTLANMLDLDWMRVPEQNTADWIAWRSKRPASKPPSQTYKLYVSPSCSVLGTVLGTVVNAASRFGASHWKVGSDVYGLLRSDKLILYFESLENLRAAAAYLLDNLEGCPSQGVPFTAELEPRGLLSWGVDLAPKRNSVWWLERESWRQRICNALAVPLLLAKHTPNIRIPPARFAALRLQLEGIDTDTWTPVL